MIESKKYRPVLDHLISNHEPFTAEVKSHHWYELLTPRAADLQRKFDALAKGQCLQVDGHDENTGLFATRVTDAPDKNTTALQISAYLGLPEELAELKLDALVLTDVDEVDELDFHYLKSLKSLYILGECPYLESISVNKGTNVVVELPESIWMQVFSKPKYGFPTGLGEDEMREEFALTKAIEKFGTPQNIEQSNMLKMGSHTAQMLTVKYCSDTEHQEVEIQSGKNLFDLVGFRLTTESEPDGHDKYCFDEIDSTIKFGDESIGKIGTEAPGKKTV
ncbi:MAG: hypothetical protein JWQ00_3253 [Noviherbaspirillum sp.]|jgi:hypothetical protein|nr:hypothetical protein [Noviherbaspirillum sp.]